MKNMRVEMQADQVSVLKSSRINFISILGYTTRSISHVNSKKKDRYFYLFTLPYLFFLIVGCIRSVTYIKSGSLFKTFYIFFCLGSNRRNKE